MCAGEKVGMSENKTQQHLRPQENPTNPVSVTRRFWRSLVKNPPTPNFFRLYVIVAPLATLLAFYSVLDVEIERLYSLLTIGLAIFYWYLLIENWPKKRMQNPRSFDHRRHDTSDISAFPISFYVYLGTLTTVSALLLFSEHWFIGAFWSLLAIPTWFTAYIHWWKRTPPNQQRDYQN